MLLPDQSPAGKLGGCSGQGQGSGAGRISCPMDGGACPGEVAMRNRCVLTGWSNPGIMVWTGFAGTRRG